MTTKLEVARVIQPDGSATVFNPAKLPQATDCTSGVCGAMAMVYLPKAKPGCIVEIGYRIRAMLNASLPEVTETLPIQREIPVQSTQIEIRVRKRRSTMSPSRTSTPPRRNRRIMDARFTVGNWVRKMPRVPAG